MVREIRPQKVPWLKVGNSQECPRVSRATPTTQGGVFLQRAAEAYVWKVVSLTPARPLWIPFRELGSKPLTRIANHKLDWVLGASTDVRAWIMSCPGPVPDPWLMELELVMKVTWKRELGFSNGLVTGWSEGHVRDLLRSLWAVGRLEVILEQALDLRGSRTQVPLRSCRVSG